MNTSPDASSVNPFDSDAAAKVRATATWLRQQVRVLVHASIPGQSDDDLLLTFIREMAGVAHEIEAAQVRLMREVEERNDTPVEDSITWRRGCRSTIELVKQHTRESNSVLSRRRALAQATSTRKTLAGQSLPAQFETVRRALDEGWITAEQAHVICSEVAKLPDWCENHVIEGAEKFFTATAAGLPTPKHIHEVTFDELIGMATNPDLDVDTRPSLPVAPEALRRQAAAWRHILDPDGKKPTEERMNRLFLKFKNLANGNVRFEGETTAEHAALWKQQLDAINSPRSRRQAIEPGEEQKTAEHSLPEKRGVSFTPAVEHTSVVEPKLSRERLNHDAFVTILSHKITNGNLPTSGGAPITVIAVVHERDGKSAGWVTTPLGEPVPVTSDRLKRWAGNTVMQRVTIDDAGAVLALSTVARGFTNTQRKAIAVRDGTCVIPGCDIGAFWCDMHHVIPWCEGGPTDVDNGVALCWRHHASIDHSGWEIEMRGGAPWVRPPATLDPVRRWQPHRNPLRG